MNITFVVPPATGVVQVAMSDQSNLVATYRLSVYNATIGASANGVTATMGSAGKMMSFSGNGWPGSDAVSVKLGVPGSTVASATAVCTVNANAAGVVPAQSCPLPTSLPYGSYSLIATDGSIAVTAPSLFTVEPGITLESQTLTSSYTPTAAAAVGQVLYVSAAGFAAGSNLSVSFNGQPVGWTTQPKTNGNGAYAPAAGFAVQPVASPGPYIVSISDQFGDTAVYTLNVLQASINYQTPNSSTCQCGVSGQQFSLSGSGWPRNDSGIQIRLVSGNNSALSPTTSTICTITSDSTGTVAPQSCTVPTNLAAGSYSLYAADSTISAGDKIAFSIDPAITVSNVTDPFGKSPAPAIYNVTVGQAVGISGTGWPPSTALTAVLGTTPLTLSPVPTIVSTGQFSGTGFTVPNLPTGPVTLTLTDGKFQASYVLQVYHASFSFSPNSQARGRNLTVSASGWPAADPITVLFGTMNGSVFTSKGTATCSLTTDTSGNLAQQTCQIPSTSLAAGQYTVLATDHAIEVPSTSLLTVS
jgi:hypothetical protein